MEKKQKVQETQKTKIIKQFSKIDTIEKLEKKSAFIKITLQLLLNQQEKNLENIYFLSNLWIPLFLTLNKETYIKKHSLQIIELFFSINIIPKIFIRELFRIYMKHLDKLYGLKKTFFNHIVKPEQLKQLYNNSLNILLNIKETESFVANKQYGYSLLNLKGDFLYFDNLSKNLLEPSKEDKDPNFFDLLIPFSIYQFKKKFKTNEKNIVEMFSENEENNPEIMSYIIYSEKNKKHYLESLKKKKKRNNRIIKKIKYDTKKIIFYKYLKALTSRFSLVKIFYTEENMSEIKFEKIKINFTKLVENSFKNEIGNNFKLAVLMETKLADVLPDFNFDLMEQDRRIKKFEEYVKDKINSN